MATIEERLLIGFDRLRCHLLNLAELIFLDVLAAEPENATALRLLGVVRCKLGHGQDGVTLLRQAAQHAAGLEVIWNDLAVALRDAGEPDAEAARARAVALRDPAAAPLAPLAGLVFASDRAVHPFELADYRYTATLRHGSGRASHPELSAILERGRDRYAAFIAEMGAMQGDFAQIPLGGRYESADPFWFNAWFHALDGMVLTTMLKRRNPKRFLEIGSGVSTKFARRAIDRYGLEFRRVLFRSDPEPRNAVDQLCDQVIRRPLEQCDPATFQALEPGDILFLDSSHRAFQGSDVTVFFTEILPRLKPGVIVHVHDIYLPDDYISGHLRQLWNEQYLLAVALLFGPERFEILFPCWWVGRDPALRGQARAAICQGPLETVDLYGASFWMQVKG